MPVAPVGPVGPGGQVHLPQLGIQIIVFFRLQSKFNHLPYNNLMLVGLFYKYNHRPNVVYEILIKYVFKLIIVNLNI
ncbi:hypothetical protein GCM10008906_04690 [Clostridium oceanicum]|uniref:Uncharacterized protein n=1 Tax=Clostridium oceanicum TaxID=1543 RepID=A0ABP3UK59_9CLOT